MHERASGRASEVKGYVCVCMCVSVCVHSDAAFQWEDERPLPPQKAAQPAFFALLVNAVLLY